MDEGRLTCRGVVRRQTWTPGAVARIVAVNTSTQQRSPHIDHLLIGDGSSLPVVRGSRFSAESVGALGAALGLCIEVVSAPVTVSQLLDDRRGRAPIPTA